MSDRGTPADTAAKAIVAADTVADAVTDPQRLFTLQRAALLDTPAEETFDRLTRLAAAVLRAPVALVSLVDKDRQFFKSSHGLQEPLASTRQTPLSHSFCQYAVASREPLVVGDARVHPVLKDNGGVVDLGVVAYAGIPLTAPDGQVLGTLCVTDTHPHHWTKEEIALLRDLADGVSVAVPPLSEVAVGGGVCAMAIGCSTPSRISTTVASTLNTARFFR